MLGTLIIQMTPEGAQEVDKHKSLAVARLMSKLEGARHRARKDRAPRHRAPRHRAPDIGRTLFERPLKCTREWPPPDTWSLGEHGI